MSEKMGLCAAYRNVSCGLASRLNPSYDRPLRPFPAALLSLEDSLRLRLAHLGTLNIEVLIALPDRSGTSQRLRTLALRGGPHDHSTRVQNRMVVPCFYGFYFHQKR